MQKVITVNLNGNAYQLEETAYAALRAYLDRAELQLKDNPDKAEIIADLEQAIADKCQRFLGPHKTVMATAEIEQIVNQMGPVEGSAGDTANARPGGQTAQETRSSEKTKTESDAPKRLYLLHEGAMISGVCKGLSAYMHIDVTIVRIIFIVLTLATGGGFALVYLGLMFIIPPAHTSEEHAAAHGKPFNAQELVDQAKQNYEHFKDGAQWRAQWRQQRRDFRRHIRQRRWMWKMRMAPPYHVGYGAQVAAGIALPILSIISAALFCVWMAVLFSLLTTGAVFGWPLPPDVPFWVGLIVAMMLYSMFAWPLHAMRRASYHALGGVHYSGVAAWDSLMGLGFAILFLWFAYQYFPEVREFVQNIPAMIDSLR